MPDRAKATPPMSESKKPKSSESFAVFVRGLFSRGGLFNTRYSSLAFMNVGLGFLNSILTIRVFGVGVEADALFISNSIIAALSLISSLWVEQFLYFYCEERAVSADSAKRFWSSAITVSLFIQVMLCGVLYLTIDPLISVFSAKLDAVRRSIIRLILPVQLLGFLVFPINAINRALFNAERRFALPFIMQLVPPSGILIALVICLVRRKPDIVLFVSCNATALLCLPAFQAVLLHRMGFQFKPRLRHAALGRYLLNSMTMRIGHNINNLLLQPLLTNTVSGMSVGNASSYGYGRKLIDVLQAVLLGPSFNILNTRIAEAWVKKDVGKIRAAIRSYITLALVLLPPCILIGTLALPPLLRLVAGNENLVDRIPLIRNLFLVLSAWLLMATIETPFVLIISAAKKSSVFILVNTINIGIIAVSLAILNRYIGIYCIPASLMVGQVFNLSMFFIVAVRMLAQEARAPSAMAHGAEDNRSSILPHVLFVAPLPPPAFGQSLAAEKLLKSLQATTDCVSINYNRVKMGSIAKRPTGICDAVRFVAAVVRARRDCTTLYLTISQSVLGNLRDLICIWLCRNLRVVLHLHGGGLKEMIFKAHPVLAWLNRRAYRRVERIVVLSESLRNIFTGMIDPARVVVVENFVEEEAFASEDEIRRKYTIRGPIRAVFLSNFIPGKGYREAARAVALLSVRLSIDGVFIGDFPDSRSRDEFLRETRVCPSVRYLGPLGQERFAHLRKCHVLLLPTQLPEGQPISILEAYASGVFVLTTGSGGILDIFQDGVNGFRIEPGSAEDVAAKLERFAALSPEDRLAVALRNHSEARRRFILATHLDQMHDLLGVPRSGSLHNEVAPDRLPP